MYLQFELNRGHNMKSSLFPAKKQSSGLPELVFLLAVVIIACGSNLQSQELKVRAQFAAYPATPPVARALANTDPTYLKLRAVTPGKAVTVTGLRLRKDAGFFTFKSGTFYLLEPINGVCTGAVFLGDATFGLTPPTELEQRYLSLLAKDHEFVEQFSEAVFRFTDGTDAEILKAAGSAASSPTGSPAGVFKEVQQQLRTRLKENLDVRLLQDLLSSQPGGKFVAFIYVELEKGQVARLGRLPIRGNTTVEQHIKLPGLGGQKPRRAMIAYLDDVLGDVENK
jgi:hypothetical protein